MKSRPGTCERQRQPFDVQICRIPAGKSAEPSVLSADSDKWLIEATDGPILRSKPLDYFDREE
jgi:hypothetical protein